MEVQKSVAYHNRLKRLSRQLAQSERLVKTHPFTQGKWTVLQTFLHRLNWQMQWMMAGPSARLLMTFQTALFAQGIEQSQTGFMGPTLLQIQKGMGRLMQASLKPGEREGVLLIVNFTQLIGMGGLFIATHLMENWKSFFPHDEDRVAAEKAGWLVRELGLNFLLGSKAAESAFRAVGQGLGLKEESQKRMTDMGMCYFLTLLLLSQEDRTSQGESFLETIKRYLDPTLLSIEQALGEAEDNPLLEKEQALLARQQIQVVRQTLTKGDREELQQALSMSFEMMGLSFEELKRDIARLCRFCAQLNKNFKNIFDRSHMTATTIQAA